MEERNIPHYVRSDELLQGGEKTNIIDEVYAALAAKKDKDIVDADQLRRQQDWSFLSQKVFGAED